MASRLRNILVDDAAQNLRHGRDPDEGLARQVPHVDEAIVRQPVTGRKNGDERLAQHEFLSQVRVRLAPDEGGIELASRKVIGEIG